MLKRAFVGWAVALAAVPLWAGEIEPITTPYDDVVGVYDGGGVRYRVTWRPDGGLYILALDPDDTASHGGPMAAAVTEDASGRLAWEGKPLVFDRKGGRVTALGREGVKEPPLRRLDPEPYTQRQFRFTSQGVKLAGTAMVPNGPGPFPAAAIIQGAGASSRSNLWAWSFAEALALRGVAALVPDKRGSGMSEGKWIEADFDTLAADAAESLAVLRSLPEIDPARSGFVGLSQGGWIAPVAARKAGASFSASLVSSFSRPLEQVSHEVRQDFEAAGLSDADVARMMDAIRRLGDFLSGNGTWESYERAAGKLREGATAKAAADYLPAQASSPNLAFLRRIHDFDFPGAVIALDAPRLLVYGALDEKDNTPVGASLRRLGDLIEADPGIDLEIRVYPGLGHTLADTRTKWISRRVLDDLAGWIKERAGARKGS